jgi:[acyl-carrier-protein] S-malonyltransferase
MGQELFESSSAARGVFEEADDALGFALSKLCFEGDKDELTLTENAQPAIVATSIATLRALEEAYPELPRPAFAAGHSLGEYSALVAAGALAFADAVRIVRIRGRAMQNAVPQGEGGMAAIMGAERSEVEALCGDCAEGDVLAPANFNAPGQIVIAGTAGAVARAVAEAKARKFKAIELKVSAPFHSPLMQPAARAVREALDTVSLSDPAFPVVANTNAEPNADKGRIADLLIRQMDSPVLWDSTMRRLVDGGVGKALEVGAGNVLSGLAKRIDKTLAVWNVNSFESIGKTREFLDS